MKHEALEKNATLLLIFSLLVVTIGGLVQIVPLFFIQNTIEKVDGMRPYSPLELAGRNVYVREGCYVCHSQMIRPFRDEVERYGHYSLAAESQFDHPFQWGSKRTGPDLARVGGKYSDEWHRQHLVNPRDVVPESIMPGYPFLAEKPLDPKGFGANLVAMNLTVNNGKGGMYSQEDIDNAEADMVAQATGQNTEGLLKRYPKAVARDFGGDGKLDEMDALIAYLQVLGTLVDFSTFKADMSR
ncbi:MAG: cytochrome-c oxidase, cbb3-type subunit II [Aestuariivirga sp.]|uniref:cytochrome-c oxidase, cbb3-type subunit II n=1 Tax=Aestuariivirga sp. TaxID=2650926 RepID=UPI0025BB386C|nr:cytochrome-c oxidase, cbb3-type subunit II [Aestuariivirga sp.]MCA3560461.1 cytochrome-c oxidase, cbb3-type subunit II [Aestuariivirga sp.]